MVVMLDPSVFVKQLLPLCSFTSRFNWKPV